MWADSGAGALSIGSFVAHFITFILFLIVLSFFFVQYLRKRKNKPMSKIISGFGIALSILLFINNIEMTFAHINFVQEQKQIINDPNYFKISNIGVQSIREGWIEDGYKNILWSIVESIIFGLLPLWLFYRQYQRINKLRTSAPY